MSRFLKRTNISDVATKAGVSKTTVSHVINQTRFVEEETRQRVLDAIAELGYRPNFLARSLTTQKTGIIGMVISDSSNQFFSEMMSGVEEILLPKSYGLMVCNTNETLEREAHYLDLLLSQRVDGIIAAATSQRWTELTRADIQHTPIVFVDRSFGNMEGPFVGVDNQRGAYLGVRHLIECGHAKIGILAGYDRLSTMRERVDGYRQALQEAGLPARADWIVDSALSIEGGQLAMRQILSLSDRPTAVFINNNLLVLGGLLALREMGLRCPDNLAIVSFDDHPWAVVADPPLTTVRQPAYELGRTAASILLSLFKHEPVRPTQVILDCELIVRQSSQVNRHCRD
jgi:LacI family transcriptional regulator